MSGKENNDQRAGDARVRAKPADAGSKDSTEKEKTRSRPTLGEPGGRVNPEVWGGATARPASRVTGPQAASRDGTPRRNKADAPPLPPRGAARARVRPAPAAGTSPPSNAEVRPKNAAGRTAPPLPLPGSTSDTKAGRPPVWARRAVPSTVAPRKDRPKPLSGASAREASGGKPVWAESGGVGPTAGAQGWGSPSAAGKAHAEQGPPQAAWGKPVEHTGPPVYLQPGSALPAVFQPVERVEHEGAAWAQKGPAQTAWSRPVEHKGPPVYLQPGPALPAVFQPVEHVKHEPAAWAQEGSAQAAWGKPVEHKGPPVWMRAGPALAAVFRPVARSPAPRPFFLGSAARPFYHRPLAEGAWVFRKSEGAGLWIFRGRSKKTIDTPQAQQRGAAYIDTRSNLPDDAAASKPWEARSFIEAEAETAQSGSSASQQQAFPYLRERASTADSPVSTRTYPTIGMSRVPSWRGRFDDAATTGALIDAHGGPPAAGAGMDEEPPGSQSSSSTRYRSNEEAAVLSSQNKLALNDDIEPRKKLSPEYQPPSLWMGALGYAMQYMIDDAMNPKRSIKIADEYIARNTTLQELGDELASLHDTDPLAYLDYPSLQDIVDIMKYTAGHIARYYDRQRRELGFDTATTFHEVGLVHNYQAFNAARDRLNELLRTGSLEPEEIALLTDPKSQITEDRWNTITDKQVRKDLQIVTQPSTLYRDIGPDGKTTHFYIAPDGVRPDIIRVLTKKGDEEMPYLVTALGHIIKGQNKRRNIQDFDRWVNDPVDYLNGEQITALEALDRFCNRLAVGDAHIIIDEVKTHPGDFSRYHSEIDFALGHTPDPGTSLKDTKLGADIAGTTQALVHLVQNALGYDDSMIRRMRRYMKAEFTEVSLRMLHEKTYDTVHAGARHLVIPVPAFRTYGVSLEELRHDWKRREGLIINQGRIAISGNVYILPYIT